MYCKNCGKELPNESQSCPFCMTNFVDEVSVQSAHDDKVHKFKGKPLIVVAFILLCIVIAVSSILLLSRKIDGRSTFGSNIKSSSKSLDSNEEYTKTLNTNEEKPKDVDKDDSLGLMNVKIDSSNFNLSETEKLLVRYFDTDYFKVPGGKTASGADPYDLLQRYPDAYEQTQIQFACIVRSIIKADSSSYIALVEYGALVGDDEKTVILETGDYAVIKGQHKTERIIVGDGLCIYGRYDGIETYNVDGKSYTVPTFTTINYGYTFSYECMSPLYSMEEIRTIAKYIFGDDIKLRSLTEKDYLDPEAMPQGQHYACELDNQSNANFSKYAFYASWGGGISDLKSNPTVKRNLTFSADFEHFYLTVFDQELETFTLESYDRNLKKEWKREFDETTSSVMDYTKDHIYLVANGNLYIINALTGEDAVESKYVGEKMVIRKLTDGILLISESKSDAVMKTDLTGKILWTTNLNSNILSYSIPVVQLVNNTYVMQYEDIEAKTSIAVINPDGTVKYDKTMF